MSLALVREEQSGDHAAVRAINEAAFGRAAEADLVEALRQAQAAAVSLVAVRGGAIAGHILFSPVAVEHAAGRRLAGLAPMAVSPAFQRQGTGSVLVREGLARCQALGFDGVVVVGHPEYYPRFGFVQARSLGLSSDYDVPPEVFMAMALPGRSLEGVSGRVRFHAAFGSI